jgi:hypothetical protein
VALHVYLGRLARLALQDRLDGSAAAIHWSHRLRATRLGRVRIAQALKLLDQFHGLSPDPRPDAAR